MGFRPPGLLVKVDLQGALVCVLLSDFVAKRMMKNLNTVANSGKSGFVKQGGGSPDEARLEQTPYPFERH